MRRTSFPYSNSTSNSVRRVCAVVGLTTAAAVLATEPLSPAEQAAIAATQVVNTEKKIIAMCQHVLVNGDVERKAELLAVLGQKTCMQAVTDGDFAPSTDP